MVRYLGINYLSEAVASRRHLLSRCLLTVPCHPDQQERETLIDDRYRLPWQKVKADKEFLKTEADGVVSATHDLVQLSDTATESVENFSPYDGLDCYVVPSSNPDSPDIFPLDDVLPALAQDQTVPDAIKEYFEHEDLRQYQTRNDDLHLDILSQEDYLSSTLKKLPSLSTLRSRFRPIQVKDPLVQDKNFGTADLRFSEDAIVPMLEQTYDGDLFRESFKSTFPACQKETNRELENVMTPPCSQAKPSSMEQAARLSKTVISLEEMPIETEASIAEIVGTQLCGLWNQTKLEHMSSSPVVTERPTFLGINEIIITEEDRFCEKAYLPVPTDDSIDEDLKAPKLPVPNVEMISNAYTSTSISLLTEREKHILTEKTFASERFCDEIQASTLPEPALDIEEAFNKDESLKETPVNKAKEILDLTPCTDIGQTELSLPWGIIKLGSEVKDSSKMLNEITVEEECGITVKPVETVEMYSKEDIYDWRDPMISVKEPTNMKVIGIQQNKSENPTKPQAIAQAVPSFGNPDVPQSSVSKVLTVPKAGSLSLPSVGSNPLDDFMALRMKMSFNVNKQLPDTETGNPEPYPVNKQSEVTIQPSSVKDPSSRPVQGRSRTKHHVVSVKLSDDFRQVLDLLSDKASYMIQALKISGDVSQLCCFESLTPDMTRFLLKQKEKQIKDGNSDADDTYRNIIGLHALSGAADIIANCCLESGIAHISAVQEKYSGILKDYLTDVRQRLFEMKALFTKRQVHHPKITALCKEVETWLKKKRAKSGDNEQKILVLIKRDLPSLLKTLKTILGLGALLIPEIITSASSEDIIKSLDQHNCLLAYSGLVDDNFPWAQFCLVVEYESQSDTVWKDHCERQNIRHIAFTLDKGDQQEVISYTSWTTTNPSQQITLIASQNITKNIELLQILEARHNIVLIERDYSLIEGCRQLYFPDVDVDEFCGIILAQIIDMRDDCMVQALVKKILALSLKLASCWVLLYSDKPSCYEFPGVIVTNLSRLEAAIANMTSKKEQWEVKVLTCSDLSEVAGCIRSISEHCMTSNTDRDKNDWLARDWLSQEISQGEKFLLMMPPITSFTAQLMLKFFSLRELMNSDLRELTAVLPYIPQKVFELLLIQANKVNGLCLEDNRPAPRAVGSENVGEAKTEVDYDSDEENRNLSPEESDDHAEQTSPNEIDKASGGDYRKPSLERRSITNTGYTNATGYTRFENEDSRMSTTFKNEDSRMSTAFNSEDSRMSTAFDNENSRMSTAFDNEDSRMSTAFDNENSRMSTAFDNENSRMSTTFGNEESRISEEGDHSFDERNASLPVENDKRITAVRQSGDNHQFSLSRNAPIARKFETTSASRSNMNKEHEDWVALENFMKAKRQLAYMEKSNNSMQRQGNVDFRNMLDKLSENSLKTTDMTDNLPKVNEVRQAINGLRGQIPKTIKQNARYPNKNREEYALGQNDMGKYDQKELSETDPNIMYPETQTRQSNSYNNLVNQPVMRNLKETYNADHSSDSPVTNVDNNDKYLTAWTRFTENEIEACVNEDLRSNRDKQSSGMPLEYTEGFSQTEIDRCLNEDLENYYNNRFCDPRKIVNYRKEPIGQVTKSGNDIDKINTEQSGERHSKINQGQVMFEGIVDEKKLDSRFDQRIESTEPRTENPRTVNLSDPLLGSLSSKLVRKRNPVYDTTVEKPTYDGSDNVNMTESASQLENINQHTRSDDRDIYPENTSRYFHNANDILPYYNKESKDSETDFNFQQLLRKAFPEMKQQSDNYGSRSDVDQFNHNQNHTSEFSEYDESLPERNNSLSERNDFSNLADSNDTFYPTTANNRQSRFDLEPNSGASTIDERRLDRQVDRIIQTNGKTTEDTKQIQLKSQQVMSEFIDNPGRFYINPNIGRLSQRPKLNNPPTKPCAQVPVNERSLADELRETTRKVLANSEQFSRLSNTSSRRPMQKLNIGLAVPLHRSQRSRNPSASHNLSSGGPSEPQSFQEQSSSITRTAYRSQTTTEPAPRQEAEASYTRNRAKELESQETQQQRLYYENTSDYESRLRSQQRTLQEQKALMMQSPWTTDNSPPMDLDYDEEYTQRDCTSTNRAVFTHQTPMKKRKLTYQAVPGTKGQTRLVFQ